MCDAIGLFRNFQLSRRVIAIVAFFGVFSTDLWAETMVKRAAREMNAYALPAQTPRLASSAVVGANAENTYMDIQNHGSTGRRITSRGLQHCVNLVWGVGRKDGSFPPTAVKSGAWNAQDGSFNFPQGCAQSWGCPGWSFCIICTEQCQSSVLDSRDDGGGTALAMDYNPFGPSEKLRGFVTWNDMNCIHNYLGGYMGGNAASTDAITAPYQEDPAETFIFPKIAVTNVAGVVVTHIVLTSDHPDKPTGGIHSQTIDDDEEEDAADAAVSGGGYANTNDGPPRKYVYTRKVGDVTPGVWMTPGVLIGTGGTISPDIAAARNCPSVGIAWAGERGDGTEFGASVSRENGLTSGLRDNDLYCMISTDAGATWGPTRNVTRRGSPAAGGYAPTGKLSVLWTPDSVFHVAYVAGHWPGYFGDFTAAARIFHWDNLTNTVRTAVSGEWSPTHCLPSAYDMNVSNPQLASCDYKVYLTFESYADPTKGEADDCAQRWFYNTWGAADGDIYVTVSNNNGFNWDVARGLVQSYTPECDTSAGGAYPDCESAVWHSTIAYGIPVFAADNFAGVTDVTASSGLDPTWNPATDSNYLFTTYILDKEPGAAPLGEGMWTYNSVRLFRFGCVEPVYADWDGGFFGYPGNIDDPTFTLPGISLDTPLVVENTGNFQISYSFTVQTISGPMNHATIIGPTSGVIGSGPINFVNLTIRLNATLSTTVENVEARIIATGTFPSSPDTLSIKYCICDLRQLQFDSLGGIMVFGNNGNLGKQDNLGRGRLNFDFQGDPCDCDTTQNSEYYLFDASPVVTRNSGGADLTHGMFDLTIIDTDHFRPLVPTTSEATYPPLSNYKWARSGEFTTQDSALGLSVDYFVPAINPLVGCWKMAFLRVSYFNRTAVSLDSVYCAYAMDWDVPSDSGADNTSGYDATDGRRLLWQRGAEYGTDTGNAACVNNDMRWVGVNLLTNQFMSAAVADGVGSGEMNIKTPQAMYTRDNASYVTGDWINNRLDSALRTISGYSIFDSPDPDSVDVDLHMVINGGKYKIDPNDTLVMWLQVVTGIGDPIDFRNTIDVARNYFRMFEQADCCTLAGDADDDGDVAIDDALWLINFIFQGGVASPCSGEADADGGGDVNIADALTVIDFIFDGPAPDPVCP